MKFAFYPTKNISMSETLFCLGAIIIKIIKSHKKVDIQTCYDFYTKEFYEKKIVKYKVSFSAFILAINYLYLIKLITIKDNMLVVTYENN